MAALWVATTASCGLGPNVGDALDVGGGQSVLCLPAPSADADSIFGSVSVRNRGTSTITITDVALVDSVDLTLLDSELVEIRQDEMGVGLRHTTTLDQLPAAWDERVAAAGAILESGEERNLALTVRAGTVGTSSARAARISYTDASGAERYQDTLTSMLVAHDSCEQAVSSYPT